MLYSVLLTIEVLLAIGVIVLVLLQHGRGADAGAAFGSGASATVFGSRGSASFLSRSTAVFATLFFINSLGLAYIVSHQRTDRSVVEQLDQGSPPAVDIPEQQGADVPATDVPTDDNVPATRDGPPPDVPRIEEPAADVPADVAKEPTDRSGVRPEDVPN